MILHGDCLEHLKAIEPNSLDSMVTDPPAGISFMGKDWDSDKGGRDGWIAWLTEVMTECHRVLKPGAHALVWAIPRTSHWTMTALENAGFEIRDVVTHLFGTGFPKSLDVSKAIDKEAGAKREVLGKEVYRKAPTAHASHSITMGSTTGEGKLKREWDITAPATDAARQWEGFGTALKPACEFWILCRKPIGEQTVAKNVLKYGTGALNIDGCRIGTESTRRPLGRQMGGGEYNGRSSDRESLDRIGGSDCGRFPSNLVLSHDEDCDAECSEGCAVRVLDEQSGERKAGGSIKAPTSSARFKNTHQQGGAQPEWEGYSDSGGASRFFYCAKASKSDRNRSARGK